MALQLCEDSKQPRCRLGDVGDGRELRQRVPGDADECRSSIDSNSKLKTAFNTTTTAIPHLGVTDLCAFSGEQARLCTFVLMSGLGTNDGLDSHVAKRLTKQGTGA